MRNPPQFPVIIGVTGHRRIAPAAMQPVRQAVEQLLGSWRGAFGPALHVLTALADGADQLVADVARRCQVPIIAVAPFHYETYRQTLRDRDTFDAHWHNAALRLVLPEVGSELGTDYQERQYGQLGVLSSRRCHLLLGLWDGDLRASQGGTADVIRMRLAGDQGAGISQQSPIFLNAESDSRGGPLLHVFTPRDRLPCPADGSVAGSCRLLGVPDRAKLRHCSALLPLIRSERQQRTGAGTNPAAVEWPGAGVEPTQVLQRILASGRNEFTMLGELNKTIGRLSDPDAALVRRQLSDLRLADLPCHSVAAAWLVKRLQDSVEAAAQPLAGSLPDSFVASDQPYRMLASLHRRWQATRRAGNLAGLAIFTLGLSLALYLVGTRDDVPLHSPDRGALSMVLVVSVLAFAAIYYHTWVAAPARRKRSQDHRALAEALRVQLYWAAAGIPASVSDHMRRKRTAESDWIAFALRGPSLWAMAVAACTRKPLREVIENDKATVGDDSAPARPH